MWRRDGYKNAEFAADLAQVARGEGAFEYRDPVEFFCPHLRHRGHDGPAGAGTSRRVSGKDGEPVIQLKTAFRRRQDPQHAGACTIMLRGTCAEQTAPPTSRL